MHVPHIRRTLYTDTKRMDGSPARYILCIRSSRQQQQTESFDVDTIENTRNLTFFMEEFHGPTHSHPNQVLMLC